MKPNPIKEKSIDFAVKTYEFCKIIEKLQLFEISKQLKRSGTSIGAQVYESQHAESTADFIHKLSISQKEANETLYWIDLVKRLCPQTINKDFISSYEKDALELKKILTSILKKLKSSKS